MEKRIAILATNGFEEVELTEPKQAIEEQGWKAEIISLENGTIKSWDKDNWGSEFQVDKTLDEVNATDYNALVLPGGVLNPDTLRQEKKAITFIQKFFEQHKPVAAICHGPQLLIEAEVVEGREVTSFPSIRKDLKNAGAIWKDMEVVTDQGLVTSRSPKDLKAFCNKLIEEVKEGKHELQHA